MTSGIRISVILITVLVIGVLLYLLIWPQKIFEKEIELYGLITCVDNSGYSTPVDFDKTKCDVMMEARPDGKIYSFFEGIEKDNLWDYMNSYVAINGKLRAFNFTKYPKVLINKIYLNFVQ